MDKTTSLTPKQKQDAFAQEHPELWAALTALFAPIDGGYAMDFHGREIGEFVLRWSGRG